MNKRSVLPNFFTLTNAFLGFLAIIYISQEHYITAAWCIIFAAICDALDGKLARLSKTYSKFGTELDSLADAVSFGVAPAFLVYETNFNTVGFWGAFFCFIFVLAGIFRLARFNITVNAYRKKKYKGLPIPVSALALSTFFIMAQYFWDTLQMTPVLLVLVPGLSLLMVSTVEYGPLPLLMVHRKYRKNILPFVYIIGLICVIINPRIWFFPWVMFYIISSLIKGIASKLREEDEEAEMAIDEDYIVK